MTKIPMDDEYLIRMTKALNDQVRRERRWLPILNIMVAVIAVIAAVMLISLLVNLFL